MSIKLPQMLDKEIHPRIKVRFDVLESLLVNKGIEIVKFESNEHDFKLRLIDQIFLGDWLTYYLALNRKKDPAEIDYINFLKQELSKIN